ncbi:MAG: Crp/Fnr family transcriptional regulator [Flavobacteriales bacterium]|nr:Crp/Fnr family transcriptional regulator [Flavobacteriales bacterium]
MNLQGLIDNIQRYISLEEREICALEDILESRTLRKKEFLLQPGQVCRSQFYVHKGLIRNYLIGEDGDEHTLQFACEDWFISDFNSYINQVAGSLFVQALEDSVVICLPYQKVEELCRVYPSFERFFRLVSQKAFAFSQKRILSNLGKSAEERYREFKDLYPNIEQRVPQYALASYLGMSSEFLSKIKNRLARNSFS